MNRLLIGISLYISLGFYFTSQAFAQQEPNVSLYFSTFIGSGATFSEFFEATTDSTGNIYAIGRADVSASDFPGVPVQVFGTLDDKNIIVIKLSPDGSQLYWVTLLGGSNLDYGGTGISLDTSQNIYIAGITRSNDFADFDQDGQAFGRDTIGFDTTHSGGISGDDAFLVKLSPDGRSLIYGTFLGGSGDESPRGGLAVDSQGFAYVVGVTSSDDFLEGASSGNPHNKENLRIGGVGDGFVTKVSQDGTSIVYSRFVGGSNDTEHGDVVAGIQVDGTGNAYLNALLRSDDAEIIHDPPDKIAFSFSGGKSDSYFAKISPDGTELVYATYFGGSGNEYAEHRIALDNNGYIAVCGFTGSTDFPTINAHMSQQDINDSNNLYLTKFDSAGQPVFSTYVGGSGNDGNCGGPEQGNIYLAGVTRSTDFETTTNAYDRSFNGDQDVFMQIYNPNGVLLYSTFIGGTEMDRARFIAVDPFDNPIIVGYSQFNDDGSPLDHFPTTIGAYDRIFDTYYDSSKGEDVGFNPYVTKFNISWPTPNWKQMLSNWLTPTDDQNGDDKINSLDWASLMPLP
jgi:hypothetical protein